MDSKEFFEKNMSQHSCFLGLYGFPKKKVSSYTVENRKSQPSEKKTMYNLRC